MECGAARRCGGLSSRSTDYGFAKEKKQELGPRGNSHPPLNIIAVVLCSKAGHQERTT